MSGDLPEKKIRLKGMRKCPVCGREFFPLNRRHIYCRESCRESTRVKKEIKTCPFCKKEFFPQNGNQMYCSKSCVAKARRARDNEKRVELCCMKCGKSFLAGCKSGRALCDECTGKEEEKAKRRAQEPVSVPMTAPRTQAWRAPRTTGRDDPGWIPVGETPDPPKVTAKMKIPASKLPKTGFAPAVRKVDRREKTQVTYEREPGRFKKGTAPYTPEDDRIIIEMDSMGETYTAIALAIGRTPTSVKSRLGKIRGKGA